MMENCQCWIFSQMKLIYLGVFVGWCHAPLDSLMDSTTYPKVKSSKGGGVGGVP